MTTYECAICHGINSVSRLHCQHCNTIPAQYSILKKPCVQAINNDLYASWNASGTGAYITVHVAFGCERQDISKTIKRAIRTVPMDYYAEV